MIRSLNVREKKIEDDPEYRLKKSKYHQKYTNQF